jgi:hypothetical protein
MSREPEDFYEFHNFDSTLSSANYTVTVCRFPSLQKLFSS